MRPDHLEELADVLRALVTAYDTGTRRDEAVAIGRARRLLARIGRTRERV
jgi:hypothetical protein